MQLVQPLLFFDWIAHLHLNVWWAKQIYLIHLWCIHVYLWYTLRLIAVHLCSALHTLLQFRVASIRDGERVNFITEDYSSSLGLDFQGNMWQNEINAWFDVQKRIHQCNWFACDESGAGIARVLVSLVLAGAWWGNFIRSRTDTDWH